MEAVSPTPLSLRRFQYSVNPRSSSSSLQHPSLGLWCQSPLSLRMSEQNIYVASVLCSFPTSPRPVLITEKLLLRWPLLPWGLQPMGIPQSVIWCGSQPSSLSPLFQFQGCSRASCFLYLGHCYLAPDRGIHNQDYSSLLSSCWFPFRARPLITGCTPHSQNPYARIKFK